MSARTKTASIFLLGCLLLAICAARLALSVCRWSISMGWIELRICANSAAKKAFVLANWAVFDRLNERRARLLASRPKLITARRKPLPPRDKRRERPGA